MMRVLQNFNTNSRGVVLASPGASQTHGLTSGFKAWYQLKMKTQKSGEIFSFGSTEFRCVSFFLLLKFEFFECQN